MKLIYLVICAVLILGGCSGQRVESTSIDNGMIEVESPKKLLSASDVSLADEYQFAVNDEVINGVDTFKLGELRITTEDPVTLTIYGSDKPIELPSEETLLTEVTNVGTTKSTYSLNEKCQYYLIKSSKECDIVIETI